MDMAKEKYTLVGVDGNCFAILGKVQRWMREEGCSKEEIDKYLNDAKSSDYNHLLCVSLDMVEQLNKRNRL